MQAFSKSRNVDAQTICDLSMQNYIEVGWTLPVVLCGVTLSVHAHRASWKVCLTTVGIERDLYGIPVQFSTNWAMRSSRFELVRQTFNLGRCGCTLRVIYITNIIFTWVDNTNTHNKYYLLCFHVELCFQMRSLVSSKSFLIKKHVDNFLHWLMPRTFIPKYTMVSQMTIIACMCYLKHKWPCCIGYMKRIRTFVFFNNLN